MGAAEVVRVVLGIMFGVAGVVVWYGVWLERESAPPETKIRGWRILLAGLAAETVLGFVVLAVDTRIDSILQNGLNRARAELVAREGRNLTETQIREIANEMKPFAGRAVIVGSYVGDGEAAALGKEIETAFTLAGLSVVNYVSKVGTSVDVGFGIRITARPPDVPFAAAIRRSLGAPGRLRIDREILPTLITIDGVTVDVMIAFKPSPTG